MVIGASRALTGFHHERIAKVRFQQIIGLLSAWSRRGAGTLGFALHRHDVTRAAMHCDERWACWNVSRPVMQIGNNAGAGCVERLLRSVSRICIGTPKGN
jgi:hypothetical protein